MNSNGQLTGLIFRIDNKLFMFMPNTQRVLSFKSFFKSIDWNLLLFLILFLNVKLVVKFAALVIYALLNRHLLFDWRKVRELPMFYPIVIVIGFLNWIIYAGFANLNYTICFGLGILIWLACFFSTKQVKYFVDKNQIGQLHNTLVAFFILNALISVFQYTLIVGETGAFNPYLYQGNHQKYFISTGDYIKGLSFDTSTTNAVLNCFAVVYFLFRKNAGMVLLCMIVLLLTASNVTNILLIALLLIIFVFDSTREQKSIIVCCIVFLVVFLAKVSPQNNSYLEGILEKLAGREGNSVVASSANPLVEKTPEDIKREYARHYLDSEAKANRPIKSPIGTVRILKPADTLTVRPSLPKANIHTEPYQFRDDTNAARRELINLSKTEQHQYRDNRPGKLVALQQTAFFFKAHPSRFLLGNGSSRFSSKLAFKATGLQFAGGYPKRFVFIDSNFKKNHLELYSHYFSQHAQRHSVLNSPNSVYDQLLSEYGIAGLLAFGFFYLGFFYSKRKSLDYGLYLGILLAGFFFLDYWFEQLSVVPIFELFVFLNLKQKQLGETGS